MADATKTDAQELNELANRLNCCSFSNADPERWHVERDYVVKAMRRMAKRMAAEPVRREQFVPARRALATPAAPLAARAAGPRTLTLKGSAR